ncbi:MAG: S8 family serine peptidase [Phycisphaerales bacterium]|nr:S8 family serine peptidase [Phycisphaerales bacterium]
MRNAISSMGCALAAAVVLFSSSAAVADIQPQPAITASFHPANVLVRTEPGADLAALDAKIGVTKVLYISQLVPGLRCVRVAEGGVPAAVAAYKADPSVLYANPDFVVHATVQGTPYGITRVNAPAVWATTRGGGTLVADLDTGVDLGHPDLPVPTATISFTGEDVQDGHGHGTHTAGTICALDNTVGVVGVAPQASLLVGKVLSNSGSGFSSWVAAGIDWSVQQNARVINMSLGSPSFDQAMADSCAAALATNTLVVAAAGNSNSSAPSYPAAYPAVLAVAAVDSSNARASFSNFGPHVSLSAPGVGVASTYVGGGTATWQGVAHDASLLSGSGPGPVTAEVVYCGLGNPADFPTAIGGVTGRIAHIRRGTLLFIDKVNNAIAAGAIGVIISNNVAGSYNGTLNTTVTIPVVGITQSDGDALQALSPSGEVVATIDTIGGHTYANLNGTSMASPHVAGVATLLAGLNGGQFTAAQIRTAMEQTATDLGDTGRDNLFGYGLVNASAAMAALNALAGCTADIGVQGGLLGHDGLLDNNDFVVFIDRFFAQDAAADLGVQGGIVGHDGLFDNNDFVAFIDAFFARSGCP